MNLESLVAELKARNATLEADHSSRLEEKQEEISDLKSKLQRSREFEDLMGSQLQECISDSVTNRRNQLAKEKVEVQLLLEKAENRLKNDEKNASRFKSEIEKLKAEKIQNEAKIEELSQQKSEFEAKIQEFVSAKAQDEGQIRELLSQNARLEANAKRLEQNKAEFSAKIQEMEGKLERAEENAKSVIQLRDDLEKAQKKVSDWEAFFASTFDKMKNCFDQRASRMSAEQKASPDSSSCNNDEDTPRPPKRAFHGSPGED
ncbi:hypothetical protein DdX_20115 [Ditylenchus destructor]|uniref:Uncharacterized protein n=1 Tax=Ditylenchus destructor TaxID=166010 RepID=A0AAD4MLZ0_9BILA|nr:hypothetical protein DdX_20115 [Ditylenchus destructor]